MHYIQMNTSLIAYAFGQYIIKQSIHSMLIIPF